VSRAVRWAIEVQDNGSATVLRGGRRMHFADDLSDAMGFVRRKRGATDRVWKVSPDGYRSEITKQV
jgi:hypothetical protein